MRFLFVGGGTGGHLTPAIGLAEGLEAHGHQTLFLLTGRAVEQAYVADGRAFASLGFDRSRWPRPFALVGAALRARSQARTFRPDVVIALGGAASAAALAVVGTPLVLLEGNLVLGRSVRWMAGFSALTLTMFEDTASHLARALAIGPVTRRSLQPIAREEARRALGLDPQRPTLLVMGGSQGATDLNRIALRLLPRLHRCGWQMLALCGAGKGQELRAASDQGLGEVVVLDHCEQMGHAYSAADFALTRGGASTVGELWLHALPAAVLPYPWHKDRQQQHNARALAPGILLLDGEDPAVHAEAILHCVDDTARRERMRDNLRARKPPDGQSLGVDKLEEIAARTP